MDYEIEQRDCPLCNKQTKHFRAEGGGTKWLCINLDEHDPLHPKSDNWTLIKRMLFDMEIYANACLAEAATLREKLAQQPAQTGEP